MLPDARLHPSSFVPPYHHQFATEPPPLAFSQQQPAIFNGPFQIIEPGSDLYIETEPNFCLELMPEEGLDTSGLYLSENGIPADVLDDVFRLDDELSTAGGCFRGPVPEGVGMGQYEAQLVAEIERLFPDVTGGGGVVKKKSSGASRLAEELTRKVSAGTMIPVVSGSPCYMNVFLKGGGRLQNNLVKPESTPERGYRCVEMVDGTGTMFKAKYYAEQMTAITTPARPSTPTPRVMSLSKFSPMVTTATTPTRMPQLKNMTPAMASKIESLANGMNRNVTLTPVRTPSRNSLLPSSSSTIVIKAPKRTIASGGTTTIFPDPFFPMPMIKQEPLDDPPPQEDPLNLPTVPQPPVNPSKQPRKQKLIKLSQNGELVFSDTTNVRERKIVPKVVQAPPPNNEYVPTRDLSEPKTHPQRTPTPNRLPNTLRSFKILPSPTSQSIPPSHSIQQRPVVPAPAPKRTRYRVHMTQTQLPPQQQHRPGVSKRVPINQTIESIEILDSSEEDDEEETTTAPESSEPEDSLPKLPGNTESIQCPYCCRIFRSSQAVLEHAQNCADASLFRQISKQKPPQRSQGQSLLKGNFPATIATRRRSPEPPASSSSSSKTSKKNRSTPSSATKRSERLSIEILPSAFNITNLLQCPECKKSFRTVEHLEQHQRIHQAPVVCEFCQKKFYETPPPKHVCQEKKRSMQ
ncbi:uncharacterized protein LOC120418966 isoform X2 [Culex pipiens pallens]|uniref:uncharacterized protein LOC120418966 isoform X2 n=1 Tax=Culex pipiens pallens TaxID=42434 RepID=UPI001953D07B|nr:uncharacterized protein LOC120418966 isoform X2 [Culex pipiens pallens]